MKYLISLSALILLLVTTSDRCLAMMDIEQVSEARAKQLGMEVKAVPAGPRDLRLTLSFDAKGELKHFARVDLEIADGGQLLASATLKDERPTPDRVVVSFVGDRLQLDKLTLRVVVQHSPRTRTGYDLRMRDFVDLEELR